MPQMGESIAEGTIAKWLKKVGDVVDRDEPLLEISTDKVDAEIPSPAAGILVAIHVTEGAMAEVNSVVAIIESDASAAASAMAAAGAPAPAPAAAPASTPVAPAPAAPAVPAVAAAVAVPEGLRVSAVARRAAGLHGVDLASVTPTGQAGRIVKQDVLARAGGAAPARSSGAPTTSGPIVGRVTGETEIVPLSVMRKKIAEHMTASKATSAHAYTLFQVDLSRVETARQAQKREFELAGAKLTVLPFILQAAARAIREFPVLNASIDGDSVVYHTDINAGVAVALETGLIVPVVKNADKLSLLEISLAIGDLAKRARAKQLKPEEVAGGTFTVTNPGNFGGAWATPIINQPQVAILEIGTVEKRVVVVNDALAIRSMVNLTLGFDHRLIDGAVADHYVSAVKRALEAWGDRS